MRAKKKIMNESGPKLLIVESPAKIKTISKFLGKDFKIMSTFGHVKDLPARKIGVTRDEKTHKIDVEYTPIKDKASVIADICKEATRCSEIYLASDPDREGEIISWHIGQEIAKVFADEAKIYRITFNEITKSAILESIQNQSHVDMNKVQAQQARRILDRWVGYEVSPILWQKITKGLSAGRVQSVAVLLVCIRENEIKTFIPEESWSIHGIFTMGDKGASVSAELYKISNKTASIKTKEDAEKIIKEIPKEQYFVAKITDKKRSKNPSAPFMTSTLQQDSYNKLNFSVDKTMMVAQKLYEGVPLADKNTPVALITYMRTDSLRIADSALDSCRSFIKKNYGTEYLPKSVNVYSKKGAQDAHEAIRPIDVTITPEQAAKYLQPDQAKLYGLIWKRFVACQMEAAEYFQRMVSIEGGKFAFKLTGSTLVFDGFLKVYMVEEDDEDGNCVALPKELVEKMSMPLKKTDSKQHFTQPPPRYTEATLVKELEKKGVGRPSTYAATLSTIQKRGYVLKDNKRFAPTELGQTVNDLLVKNLPDIINVTFTAKMEEDLDKIAQGEVDRDVVLNEFYEKFEKDLETFGIKAKKHSVETNIKCPQCDNVLVIRYGKAGSFLGCSKFPTCAYTANYKRDEQDQIVVDTQQDAVISELGACPNCAKPLVKKMGKFGPFIACSGYPECKHIHQETLKMPCPNCGKKVTQRRWRGGKFWGCSGYPDCKFSIFSAVVETPCPKCKLPYLLVKKDKEGNETHTCPNKECGFSEKKGEA